MHFSRKGHSAGCGPGGSRIRVRVLLAGLAALATAIVAASPASAGQPVGLSGLASPLSSPGSPTVTKVLAKNGPAAGGTHVTITGANFTGATEVRFGANGASFTIKSSSSIKAISPPGKGIVDVTVTTPEGTSATSEADQFTYIPTTPVVTGVFPAETPVHGGQTIRITGTGFAGATAVDFGSTAGTNIKIKGETSITVVDPPGTGTVDVTVTTPEGTSPVTPEDTLTYVGHPPEVSGVGPRTGLAAGGQSVGIGGLNFFGATAVHFGSIDAPSFTVNSDKSITATAPAETVGTVDVTVTTPYGTSSFEYCGKGRPCAVEDHYKFKEPTITSVTPSSGSTAGGTSVAVTGSGFAPGTTATSFLFGTTPAASVECSSSSACTVVSPAHKAGAQDVRFRVSGDQEQSKKTAADRFTFG
jgi:hypothetical protein